MILSSCGHGPSQSTPSWRQLEGTRGRISCINVVGEATVCVGEASGSVAKANETVRPLLILCRNYLITVLRSLQSH